MKAAKAMDNEALGSGNVTLTPEEAKELLVGVYLSGRFTRTNMLRGAPGIGKTAITKQAAAELAKLIPGFDYIEINPTMPADEVCGIPDLIRMEGQATKTDYAMPIWFPTDPEWKGIICLDDAAQGDRMMQQTLANLIHARNLRGHHLPEGAMIVATGNRVEDKAGVTKTLTHFADRMDYIDIEADAQSWIDNFAIPKQLDPRIIAYIHMDKSKLNGFNPNAEKNTTSRSWEAVNDALVFLDTVKDTTKRNKFAQSKIGGAIGIGEGIKFWAFCTRFEDMPDLDAILADPENHDADFKPDIKYAVTLALAQRLDNTNFTAATTFVDRLGQDFTVLLIKVALKRHPALKEAKAFTTWMVKNQKIILGTGPGV